MGGVINFPKYVMAFRPCDSDRRKRPMKNILFINQSESRRLLLEEELLEKTIGWSLLKAFGKHCQSTGN